MLTGDGDDLIVVVDHPQSSPRLAFGCKHSMILTLVIIISLIILRRPKVDTLYFTDTRAMT